MVGTSMNERLQHAMASMAAVAERARYLIRDEQEALAMRVEALAEGLHWEQYFHLPDRFLHLLKNLGEVVEPVLLRHTALVQRLPVPDAPGAHAAPPRRDREAARTRTRENTHARYAAIHALAAKRLSHRAIARALGQNRKTVQTYLDAATAPERPRQPPPTGSNASLGSHARRAPHC